MEVMVIYVWQCMAVLYIYICGIYSDGCNYEVVMHFVHTFKQILLV